MSAEVTGIGAKVSGVSAEVRCQVAGGAASLSGTWGKGLASIPASGAAPSLGFLRAHPHLRWV